jgi:TonB family protein
MRVRTIILPETRSRMPRDPRSTVAEPVSLADRVYRPRLAEGNDPVRRANRAISLPVTLLGYLALGLLGWMAVRHARALQAESPKTVVVDLTDLSDGETPPAPVPVPAPASAGGPPPGALEKADAPPPPLPANPDVVPEKPPTELPSQDLSGVAFPSAPVGTTGGSATGAVVGETPGPGSGQGPRVVEYSFSQVEVRFQPKLEYPPLAQRARIQGVVKVAITVGLEGTPLSAKALGGPPLLRSFAEAYALKWRFKPSLENGIPVLASFTLTVNYELR